MEPHGDHRLHPGEQTDGVVGATGLGKNVVGGLHVLGGQLGRPHVQTPLDGQKDGDEAVRLIGVVRRSAEDGGLGLKPRPGPQGEADVAAVGVNPLTLQNAVHHLGRCGGEDHRGIGGEDDLRLRHPHVLQFLGGVCVP